MPLGDLDRGRGVSSILRSLLLGGPPLLALNECMHASLAPSIDAGCTDFLVRLVGTPTDTPQHKTDLILAVCSWIMVTASRRGDRFRISDRPHALDVDSSCTSMPVEAAEEPASSETEVVGSPSTMPEDVEPRDTTQERLQALERSLCLLQDKGGEGNISVSRVAEAMKCIGIHYKYDDLAAELLSNDTDGDGSMEVHEFTGFLKQDAELEWSGVTTLLNLGLLGAHWHWMRCCSPHVRLVRTRRCRT